MADGQHRALVQELSAQCDDLGGSRFMVGLGVGELVLDQALAGGVLGFEAGLLPDPLDLAAQQQRAVHARFVHRKLDARRAGVEDGDAAPGCRNTALSPTPTPCRRRAVATTPATAQEASRVSRESARLVRMMGTRVPS